MWAFRERRTEYIKQLEETIRVHEVNLHNLQTGRQSAADVCIMLRYKNSLLERMLLEKGSQTNVPNIGEKYLPVLPISIDVHAELEAKTNSLKVDLTHVRTRATRSHSSIAPKIEPKESPRSPQSHPTPSFLVEAHHGHIVAEGGEDNAVNVEMLAQVQQSEIQLQDKNNGNDIV
jgi:hypothetical protein